MAEPTGMLSQMGERLLPFQEVGPGRHPFKAERRAEHDGEEAAGKGGNAQYAVDRQPVRQGGADDLRVEGHRREQEDKRTETARDHRYPRPGMGRCGRRGEPGRRGGGREGGGAPVGLSGPDGKDTGRPCLQEGVHGVGREDGNRAGSGDLVMPAILERLCPGKVEMGHRKDLRDLQFLQATGQGL